MPFSLRIQQLKETRDHFHLPIMHMSCKDNIPMNVSIPDLHICLCCFLYPSYLFIYFLHFSPRGLLYHVCFFFTYLFPLMQLSCVKCDLEEMDYIMSTRESSLTEQLLPSKHSFFIRESR
jgi:hypothetical protein